MHAPVLDIYRHYEVPPNLVRHLLRTAAVASLMCDAWRGPAVDRDRLVRVLLLHDVGNIVKADYVALPQMLEEEQPNVAHWLDVQRRYRSRFGADAERATRVLAQEIGLGPEELALLDRMSFMRNDQTLARPDYEAKLAAYADQRVGPFGVVSIGERFEEAKSRYGVSAGAGPSPFMSSPRAARLIACAHAIEAQLMVHCALAPEDIDDAAIQPTVDALRTLAFPRADATRSASGPAATQSD